MTQLVFPSFDRQSHHVDCPIFLHDFPLCLCDGLRAADSIPDESDEECDA